MDWQTVDARQVAAAVLEHLRSHGIVATLVGGACVSIYTENRYQSSDLDLVTHASLKELSKALAPLDFVGTGREFRREGCPFYLDFVAPPLAVGGEPVHATQVIQTELGALRLLTPTDCVKDRLAAYYHWNDPQALEQAVMVARAQASALDLREIERWSRQEGHREKFGAFREASGE